MKLTSHHAMLLLVAMCGVLYGAWSIYRFEEIRKPDMRWSTTEEYYNFNQGD